MEDLESLKSINLLYFKFGTFIIMAFEEVGFCGPRHAIC